MHHVGKTIRNIRIVDELGFGGMGQVYVGLDERLGRQVAVKAVRPERRMDQRAKARFLREAQILSRLEHPNICRIYDFIEFEHEEHDFIVLELVQGTDLRRLNTAEMRFADKLNLAIQICRALVAAHGMGIIHRDLKPDNVMVDTTGQVKVLDFGLARAEVSTEGNARVRTAPEPLPEHPDGDPTLTAMGDIVGTPGAMSPEQARGEQSTAASDMYSFGLILQELFTGRRPYPEDIPPARAAPEADVGRHPASDRGGLGAHRPDRAPHLAVTG